MYPEKIVPVEQRTAYLEQLEAVMTELVKLTAASQSLVQDLGDNGIDVRLILQIQQYSDAILSFDGRLRELWTLD